MLTLVDLPHPGTVFTFSYPRRNRHGRGLQLVKRTVRVLALEDAREVPISISDFLRSPQIRRGRWRIIAWDPEKRGKRTYYVDFNAPCKLQLGTYDILTGQCNNRIGPAYEQTPEGLMELLEICRELLNDPPDCDAQLTLALYAAA